MKRAAGGKAALLDLRDVDTSLRGSGGALVRVWM